MNWKCFWKGHSWIKIGGPRHVGEGKFQQFMKCSKCGKTKYQRS